VNLIRNRNRATLRRAGNPKARAILRHGPAYSRVHSVLYLYPGPAQDGTTFLFYQRTRAGHPEEGLSRTFKPQRQANMPVSKGEEGLSRTFKPQRQANMPVSKGEEGLGKILKFHRQANMPVSPAHRRLALGWKGEEGKQMARAILRHGPAYSRVHSVLSLYPGPAQDGTTFLFYQKKNGPP
jgi:hypothetical protein